jgi:hypothetical protein
MVLTNLYDKMSLFLTHRWFAFIEKGYAMEKRVESSLYTYI